MPSFADVEAAEQGRGQNLPGMKDPMSSEEYTSRVESGQAVHGVGGAYPVNQQLAGMDRPKREPSSNKAELKEGLEAIAKATKEARESADPEPATTSAEAVPDAPEREVGDEDLAKTLDELAPDSFSALQAAIKRKASDATRRKEIEDRCEPMDLAKVILSQDAVQEVPIVPDGLEPTFRTLNGHEDSWVKDFVWRETKGDSSDLYYQTRVGLVALALSLVAINGKEMIEHRASSGSGEINKKEALEKLQFILKYPMSILLELSVNQQWFEERVGELTRGESVKNG